MPGDGAALAYVACCVTCAALGADAIAGAALAAEPVAVEPAAAAPAAVAPATAASAGAAPTLPALFGPPDIVADDGTVVPVVAGAIAYVGVLAPGTPEAVDKVAALVPGVPAIANVGVLEPGAPDAIANVGAPELGVPEAVANAGEVEPTAPGAIDALFLATATAGVAPEPGTATARAAQSWCECSNVYERSRRHPPTTVAISTLARCGFRRPGACQGEANSFNAERYFLPRPLLVLSKPCIFRLRGATRAPRWEP